MCMAFLIWILLMTNAKEKKSNLQHMCSILHYHHLHYLVRALPSCTIVHHHLHHHVLHQNMHHDIMHHPTSGASPSCSSSNYLTDYLGEIYGSPWEARTTWKWKNGKFHGLNRKVAKTNDFVRWQCRCRL